jgi:hypothetical protein
MVERTNKAISDVANEGNFTYIFDTSTGFVLSTTRARTSCRW